MPIVKTQAGKGRSGLSGKPICWECGQRAVAFVISPSDGRGRCPDCDPINFVGVKPVKKRAKKA
jgi:hypothetical protein